jgi:cell division protein FtsN
MKQNDSLPPAPLPTEWGDGRSHCSQSYVAPGSGRPFAQRSAINQRGGMLIGVFVGLVIGVLIAFGVVWYLKKSPLPFLDKISHAEKSDAKSATEGQGPLPLPGKPGDKVTERPRFEFYKILPGGEATPSDKAPGTPTQQPQVAAAAPVESFYLQAGAFQKSADADNLKAKLAMMGLEADVQEVTLAEKGAMHRVRVGPFGTPDEMNRVRNQLAQSGIQATVVKASRP